jgi:hypothetical protein
MKFKMPTWLTPIVMFTIGFVIYLGCLIYTTIDEHPLNTPKRALTLPQEVELMTPDHQRNSAVDRVDIENCCSCTCKCYK